MSFIGQKAIHYFIDQFNNWLLIVYIKTSLVLKRLLFDNSEIKEMALVVFKYQRFDKYDNNKE